MRSVSTKPTGGKGREEEKRWDGEEEEKKRQCPP